MVDTLKEVAEQSTEAIISMVRDYSQNVDVILGERGLLAAGSTGKTIIVMSTLDPESMNGLGQRVESESGFKLISAAVSGGASGASAGTLSIMTSGSEKIVKSLQPVFDAMGSNVFFYGDKPGNSQVAKLVNNMILGINMNAVAEGLRLSNSFGLPEEELLKLLKVSTGDSWVVRNWSDVSKWTADTIQRRTIVVATSALLRWSPEMTSIWKPLLAAMKSAAASVAATTEPEPDRSAYAPDKSVSTPTLIRICAWAEAVMQRAKAAPASNRMAVFIALSSSA